jgi:predicted nuclease with TOPRIM domain
MKKEGKNMSDTRELYVEKMKAKLDEWNAEIDKLEAKSRQKEADAREAYEKKIESIKEKRQATKENLDNMQQAGENAWEDLKAGVEKAAASLGEAIRSAQSRF